MCSQENSGLCLQWKKSQMLTDEMEWGSKFYVPDARGADKRAKQHLLTMEEQHHSQAFLIFRIWYTTLVEEV